MPKKKTSGGLTPEQLGAIAETSLANAASLINEARALYTAGAAARAYSLAVLAGEEFGKCQLAVGTVGRSTESDDDAHWKEWWTVFYGHGPKLARAASFAAQVIPPELVERFVKILDPALKQQRREVGFYVDVDARTRQPVSPSTAISDVEAHDAVVTFGEVIDLYVALFDEVGLAWAYTEANEGPALEMRAALASRDPETIRSTWEATTGRLLEQDELDHIMTMLEGQ